MKLTMLEEENFETKTSEMEKIFKCFLPSQRSGLGGYENIIYIGYEKTIPFVLIEYNFMTSYYQCEIRITKEGDYWLFTRADRSNSIHGTYYEPIYIVNVAGKKIEEALSFMTERIIQMLIDNSRHCSGNIQKKQTNKLKKNLQKYLIIKQ